MTEKTKTKMKKCSLRSTYPKQGDLLRMTSPTTLYATPMFKQHDKKHIPWTASGTDIMHMYIEPDEIILVLRKTEKNTFNGISTLNINVLYKNLVGWITLFERGTTNRLKYELIASCY